MLKRKLQYFGHLMGRADSFEKTLMLGKIEGGRRRGWQRMRWLDGVIDSVDMSLCILREMLKEREAWHAVVHGVTNSRTRLSDWTTKTRSQINESFIDLLQSSFSTTCLSHVFWGSWTQFQCMSVCRGRAPSHINKQFSGHQVVSYDSTQFWHCIPRYSVRFQSQGSVPQECPICSLLSHFSYLLCLWPAG